MLMQFSQRSGPCAGKGLLSPERRHDLVPGWTSAAETEIFPADEILIPGVHNIENYMAAFCAVDGLVPVSR